MIKTFVHCILLQIFLCCILNNNSVAQKIKFKVIAFYTAKHDAAHISFVHEANKWFPVMGKKYHFSYDSTNDWTNMNEKFLSQYQVVIFLDTRPGCNLGSCHQFTRPSSARATGRSWHTTSLIACISSKKNAPYTRALTLLPLKRTSEDAGSERRDYGVVDSLGTFIFGDPQRNATKIRARIDCLLALNRN